MTATTSPTRRPLTIGQKIVWIVGIAVVTLLVVGTFASESNPTSGLNPPPGAYAECQTFVDMVNRGESMTAGEALGSLARLHQAAEGGPLETHVGMLLTAVDSGDNGRIELATGAMLDRCANG